MSRTATVNGVRLEYDDAGAGVPIITLHGGPGMSSRASDWATFQPLTYRYRLISYDQRGSGASEGAEPYSHEQLTSDLDALRAQLGLERVVLLGGSYGGFVALEYALRYPQHLHAVILRDTAASSRHEGSAKQRALSSGLPMNQVALDRMFAGQLRDDDDFRQTFGMIQPLYSTRYDPEEGARRLARIPFRYQTHNWAFSRNQPSYDIVARLPEIQLPVLVTVGRHDWITPLAASEELAARLPQAELVVFEHSGHSPQLEETERFLQVVRDFLGRHLPVES